MLRLVLAYDGTAYLGWQKTNVGPSIEETLQNAIEQILQEKVILQAASRTDRGVHAQGQVVSFHSKSLALELTKLHRQLNAVLPHDIRILSVEQVNPNFHPTLDVIEKTYVYDISAAIFQTPFKRHHYWHVFYPLDVELMKKAALMLKGTHDFQGFTNQKPDAHETTTRTINHVFIEELADNHLRITVKGIHFLYKMVRNIVGTLVFIGCKKLPIHAIDEVLTHKKRADAGMTAPAHGLTLMHIKYTE